MSFLFPISSAEFLAAATNPYSFTATGPDKVAHLMLKRLPCFSMDFLLHIFNIDWSLHFFSPSGRYLQIFPSIKLKKLDSPASFLSISLTSCVSKIFERIILSRLFFFLKYSSILSPCQAVFRPRRTTLDQIGYLSQFISDKFNKLRLSSRTILVTIDFSKAFDLFPQTYFHWPPSLLCALDSIFPF